MEFLKRWPFRVHSRQGGARDWRQAGPMDLPLVADLLRLNEPLAMNLLDNFFRVRQGNLLPFKSDWWDHFVLYQPEGAPVLACLGLSSGGYLHSLAHPGASGEACDWMAGLGALQDCTPRLISRLFGGILCPDSAQALVPVIKKTLRSRKTYRLLELPCGTALDESGGAPVWPPLHDTDRELEDAESGLLFRTAHQEDARFLLDIQCAYEIEEVLCSDQDLDSWQSLARLEVQLKKHRIWLAQTAERAVAKAGTNALSWNYIQIGGVYTDPLWRNRGIARQLVSLLVADGRACGLGSSLFVKENNIPALRVYEQLGFEACGELEILYFT